MSDLAETQRYAVNAAHDNGHSLGEWRWVGTHEQPRHEARCKTCGGLVQVAWDREQRRWNVHGSPMSHAC